MSVTPELKRMIAEREARESADNARRVALHKAEARAELRSAAIFDAIDKAAPFLDTSPRSQASWPASSLLKIGYCVVATSEGEGGARRAEEFVTDLLETARDRYRAGFHADPFTLEPVRR